MASLDRARIASIVSSVDDHAARVGELGERLSGSGDSDAAGALFEAERNLRMASRALDRARAILPD